MKLFRKILEDSKKETVAIFSTERLDDSFKNDCLRQTMAFYFLSINRIKYRAGWSRYNNNLVNTLVCIVNTEQLEQLKSFVFEVLAQDSILVRKEDGVFLYYPDATEQKIGKELKACSAAVENTPDDFTYLDRCFYIVQ